MKLKLRMLSVILFLRRVSRLGCVSLVLTFDRANKFLDRSCSLSCSV